jgi:hypothetical protein
MLKKFLFNKEVFFIALIIIIGFFIRSYNLKDNFIFAYDQGRDAQRVFEIISNGDLKIVGPETDIPGVFNGPLLYYLILPFYFLSNFNPNAVIILFIFINLSAVILFYFFSIRILNNFYIFLIASILWIFSYAQLNFSRFISNASPMSICTLGFFVGLAFYFLKKEKKGLILSSVFLVLAIHFNFYLIYLLLMYPIFYLIYEKKLFTKELLISASIFLILISNFIVAEIKWNFLGIRSLINYFEHQSENFYPITESLSIYLQRFGEAIYYSIFSFNIFIGLILFLILAYLSLKVIKNYKEKVFILIWLLSTLPLFGSRSGVINGTVINSSLFPILTLIAASGLYYFIKRKENYITYFFITLIIFSNIFLLLKDKIAVKLFSLQPLVYTYEKKLIDYTYSESNKSKNKNFSICVVSNPLFINTLWSYLYFFYGQKKYNYLPYYAGPKQYLNKNFLPYDKNHVKLRFLIIEPLGGIPDYAKKATIYKEDKVSKLIEEKKFGDIIVQKRILTENKNELVDTQRLSPQEKNELEKITKNDHRYSCYHTYD